MSRSTSNLGQNLERETGFEPATSTLARSHSTTELLPLDRHIVSFSALDSQRGPRRNHGAPALFLPQRIHRLNPRRPKCR
jgi:hypothetical protein